MFNVIASGVNVVNTWGGVCAAFVGGMDIDDSAGRDWVEGGTSHLLGGVDLLPDEDACLARVFDHSRSAPMLMSRVKPSMTACVTSGDRSKRNSCME